MAKIGYTDTILIFCKSSLRSPPFTGAPTGRQMHKELQEMIMFVSAVLAVPFIDMPRQSTQGVVGR